MVKNYCLRCLLLFASFQINAQDDHSFQWRYETESGANMIQLDVLPLADRGYVCSGLVESPAGSAFYYPYILRMDCLGRVLWSKMFNQATESANNVSGRVLQISETDFVLVGNVGFYFTTPRNDIFLARVDGDGNTVWTRRIGGGTNNQDVAQSALIASDGNIVISGQTGSWGTDAGTNNNYTDQYFLKISPAGNILWTRTVGNPQKVDRSFDIVELPDQSLVAAGSYIHTGGTFYANLLKMDKNGTVQWSRVVTGGGPDLFENASGAVEKPNGDFAIMCATSSFPTVGFVGNKYAVLSLTPTGGLVTLKTYNLGSSHYPKIHRHPQENSFLISGFTNWTGYGGNGNRFDPILINLDADFKVSCSFADYTGFTSVYDPAFDFDDAPSTQGVGGTLVNSLVESSNFELKQDVVCENRPYETCSPFSEANDYAAAKQGFEVFPNPAQANSPISLRWQGLEVELVNICDVHGRLIHQYHPVPGADNLDLRIETPGIYWVYLQGQGRSSAEKVVVME